MRETIRKYAGNYTDRVVALTVFSVVVNLISAVGKLILGIKLNSLWYIFNGAYYAVLVAARITSIFTYGRAKRAADDDIRADIETRYYKRSGLFIFLMAAVYFALCIHMFKQEYAVVAEGGWMIAAVVGIVVYKLIFSVYGLIVARRLHDKVTETLKTVSFTDAGVSLVIAFCTLMNLVDKTVAVKSSAVLGLVISLAFMISGMIMTVSRSRRLKGT